MDSSPSQHISPLFLMFKKSFGRHQRWDRDDNEYVNIMIFVVTVLTILDYRAICNKNGFEIVMQIFARAL